MGAELCQQYDLLAKGTEERTGSGPAHDVIGDIQPIKNRVNEEFAVARQNIVDVTVEN